MWKRAVLFFLELPPLGFPDKSMSARVCNGLRNVNTYAVLVYTVYGRGGGCTRYCVRSASSAAGVTRENQFTGDFGNRRGWLPHIVWGLCDLIHKDCGRVDKWGAITGDWGDVGLMSHDRGVPNRLPVRGVRHVGCQLLRVCDHSSMH